MKILGLALLLLLPFQDTEKKETKQKPQQDLEIVARVNDEIITRKQLAQRMEGVQSPTPAQTRVVLQTMAGKMLRLQAARAHKIDVTEDDISEFVDRHARHYNEGSLKKLQESLLYQGKTMTQFREETREYILNERLYRYLAYRGLQGDIPLVMVNEVSPEEVRAYYEKNRDHYHAESHITAWRIGIHFDDGNKAVRKKLIDSLLRRLKMGYEIQVLAMYYSETFWTDTGTTEGRPVHFIKDLIRKNSPYSEATTKILFDDLKMGETSDVVEEGQTFSIFQIETRTDRKEFSFEEAQVLIRGHLRSQLSKKNQKRIVDLLRKKAFYSPEDLFDESASE